MCFAGPGRGCEYTSGGLIPEKFAQTQYKLAHDIPHRLLSPRYESLKDRPTVVTGSREEPMG